MENEEEEEKEVMHNYSPSIQLFDTRSPYLKEKQRLSRESIQEEKDDASLQQIRSSFQNKKTKKQQREKSTPPPHKRDNSREKQRVRKSSQLSDISMRSKKPKKQKPLRGGEIKHTRPKSKSPSLGRRENIANSSASPFRREKFRPQSAKHSQKESKFNFSPYQTERSKAQELSMRIKKERKTRERLMEDIKDFQKEVKGKNRHSAVKLDLDEDTPKFKDAYEGVKKRGGKDAVMEKLNKKLRQLQHL